VSSRVKKGVGAKDLWRPFLACLAIANLWYLLSWRDVEVLFLERTNYFRKGAPTLIYFTSVVLSVLLVAIALSVVYLVIARWWPRHLRTFATVGVGFLLAMCTYRWPGYNMTLRMLTAGVPLAGAALARRFPGGRLMSFAGNLLVTASLLFFIQAGSSLWAYFRVTRPLSQYANDRPAPRQAAQAAQAAQRVVWVVFDELDYELVFPLRPADVELPELDRLRGESFFATRAFSPSAVTAQSFPSFLIGRIVAKVNDSKVDNAELTFAPNEEVGTWATHRNLFADLRKQGWDAGLVGWHNPYCRVIGDDLAYCEWEPNLDANSSLLKEYSVYQIGLIPVDAIIHGHPRRLLRPGPARDGRYELLRDGHVKQYQVTMAHARRLIRDTNLDLVLIHCLVPHPPGIYNRKRNRIDTDHPGNYFDNLELMDHTLGELRNELESSGLWDSTTFIVTSDHYLRRFVWAGRPVWTAEEDNLTKKRGQPRVPFLIKFADSRQPVTYDAAFNTVLIHDLIPELMRRQVPDAASVSRWFDANRGRFPAKTIDRGELER
jgi:hypothetical protein